MTQSGVNYASPRQRGPSIKWALGFAIVTIVGAASYYIGTMSGRTVSEKPTAPPAIAEAEQAITFEMRDPDSVHFRNVATYTSKKVLNLEAVCGEVNAKNSFGGYVGFTPFITLVGSPGKPYTIIAKGDFSEIDKLVTEYRVQFCHNNFIYSGPDGVAPKDFMRQNVAAELALETARDLR